MLCKPCPVCTRRKSSAPHVVSGGRPICADPAVMHARPGRRCTGGNPVRRRQTNGRYSHRETFHLILVDLVRRPAASGGDLGQQNPVFVDLFIPDHFSPFSYLHEAESGDLWLKIQDPAASPSSEHLGPADHLGRRPLLEELDIRRPGRNRPGTLMISSPFRAF